MNEEELYPEPMSDEEAEYHGLMEYATYTGMVIGRADVLIEQCKRDAPPSGRDLSHIECPF